MCVLGAACACSRCAHQAGAAGSSDLGVDCTARTLLRRCCPRVQRPPGCLVCLMRLQQSVLFMHGCSAVLRPRLAGRREMSAGLRRQGALCRPWTSSVMSPPQLHTSLPSVIFTRVNRCCCAFWPDRCVKHGRQLPACTDRQLTQQCGQQQLACTPPVWHSGCPAVGNAACMQSSTTSPTHLLGGDRRMPGRICARIGAARQARAPKPFGLQGLFGSASAPPKPLRISQTLSSVQPCACVKRL